MTSARDRSWVLVVDASERSAGRGRAAVAAVRAADLAGYKAAITVSDGVSLAANSRHCSRRVRVPSVGDRAFAGAIRAELDHPSYVAHVHASDSSLIAMTAPGHDLLDKTRLEQAALAAGLSVPPTKLCSSPEEVSLAGEDLGWPVIVKPNEHRYSPFIARSSNDLKAMMDGGPALVQPYLNGESRAISGLMWRGELIAAVHQRWIRSWRIDCGNVCAAETVAVDERLEEPLARMLSGYSGIFNAQFKDGYLLDLHPRMFGTHALAMAAGVNLVALYCELVQGRYAAPVRGKPGAFFRWLEGDLRHIHRAVRDKRMSVPAALNAIRPRRGAAHDIESVTDPGPLLARIRFSAARVGMSQEDKRMARVLARDAG